jgi:predicted nuclease with TOPRIM domain
VEEHLERADFEILEPKFKLLSSSPTASNSNFSNRKKVLMENQLDLTEQEMDYYEELVNSLAEKLEKVTHEKTDLQPKNSSLTENVNNLDGERRLLTARNDEFVELLAQNELEMTHLRKVEVFRLIAFVLNVLVGEGVVYRIL